MLREHRQARIPLVCVCVCVCVSRQEAEREVATRREEVRGFVLERLQARYGRFLAKQDLVGFLREIGVSVSWCTHIRQQRTRHCINARIVHIQALAQWV